MIFLSKSEEETKKVAIDFASSIKSSQNDEAKVVGLYGELGAGKTTFMKYLAEFLGVEETIQSPTFVIMKIYEIFKGEVLRSLIHIDAYRIEKEEEMLNLGWGEIIKDPKNLICIEWPERIKGIMPEHTKIFFEHLEENERKITIRM